MAQSPLYYSRSYSRSHSHSHSTSHTHSQPQSQTHSPHSQVGSRSSSSSRLPSPSPSLSSAAVAMPVQIDRTANVATAAAAAAPHHSSTHHYHHHHHPHHHRHHHGSMSVSSASLSSVDLQSRSSSAHLKDADRDGAHSRVADLPSASDIAHSTAAHARDVHSNAHAHMRHGDAVHSAQSSHFPSRRGSVVDPYAGSSVASSLYPSAVHSLAASGATTQYASPVSKNDADHNDTAAHVAAGSVGGPMQSGTVHHYVDSLASSQKQSHHRTESQIGESHMSLGGLTLSHSSSAESLDGAAHTYQPVRPRTRPVHFTFAQEHVIKSLLKAAEKDRQRAEREAEKAREAQQRAAMERERDAARAQKIYQHQREQQAREEAYKMSLRRAELERQRQREAIRDTSSSDSNSDDYDSSYSDSPDHAVERVRSPLQPVHFKFDSHDIRKSYAKPSQRQQIGHWTTFPRSSTTMYPGSQLRAWIASLARTRLESERKMQSAPASPLAHQDSAARHGHQQFHPQDAIRQQLGESSGSLSGKGMQFQGANRRSSMPVSQSDAHTSHAHSHSSSTSALVPLDAKQTVQQLRNQPTRLTHTRSRTLSDIERDSVDSTATAQHDHDKSKHATPGADQKLSARGGTDGGEKNTGIRRSGGHSRRSSAGSVEMSRVGLHELRGAPLKAVPLGTAQVAGGADGSSRRSQLLNQQRASMNPAHSSATSSAASSAHTSPTRSGVQQSQPPQYVHPYPQPRQHHASTRIGSSAHVSPSRRERALRTAVARSATLPAASSHAFLPPQPHAHTSSAGTVTASSRRVTHGNDNKVSSAADSPLPVMRAASLPSAGASDSAWPPPPPSALPAAVYASLPQMGSHHKSDSTIDSWTNMAHSGHKLMGVHASPLFGKDAASYHGPKSTVPTVHHHQR